MKLCSNADYQTLKQSQEWKTISQLLTILKPPPKLKVSEWTDENRVLSKETSSSPGRWRTNKIEYAREIMDCFCDPEIEEIYVMSSTQIGKTEIMNNIVGYFMSQDPSPGIIMLPTLELATSYSKDRFDNMVRDTKCLEPLLTKKNKSSDNTNLYKSGPGFNIDLVGANSPAGLSSKPKRWALVDEVDRCPFSSGKEGDPVDLIMRRTTNFWNRKIGLFSTPTIKNLSRIEKAYKESDQRQYWVPCKKCGEFQLLFFDNVKWDKTDLGEHLPETAYYECNKCNCRLDDSDLIKAVKKGKWIAQNKKIKNKAGFFINELYSPWITLKQSVETFLRAKKKGIESIRTWSNTSLGETFDYKGSEIDTNALVNRKEVYNHKIPEGVLILILSIDVQADRFELLLMGHGIKGESWIIEHKKIYGTPNSLRAQEEIDLYRTAIFLHETNKKLKISVVTIDSGYETKTIEDFVKPRQKEQVFAIKGKGGFGYPFITMPSITKIKKNEVAPVIVGVDTGKDNLFSKLSVKNHGANFLHIPETLPDNILKQLGAEKRIEDHKKGQFVGHKYIKIKARNELIDLVNYNFAGFAILNYSEEQLQTYKERMFSNAPKESNQTQKRRGRIIHPGY